MLTIQITLSSSSSNGIISGVHTRTLNFEVIFGPRTHNHDNRYGDRAFSACAPLLWNNLPSHIQDSPTIDTFKKKLKTHLFVQQFNNHVTTDFFLSFFSPSFFSITWYIHLFVFVNLHVYVIFPAGNIIEC